MLNHVSVSETKVYFVFCQTKLKLNAGIFTYTWNGLMCTIISKAFLE